jgi:tRNA(Ile)-lysidine synthase
MTNDNYFRPLLSVTKREILEYAKDQNILYGIDETNNDRKIPRNPLRHEVIPHLEAINPEVNKALRRLSQSAQEIKEGFDIFFAEIIKQKKIDYNWYHSLPIGFQHELLRCLYEAAN